MLKFIKRILQLLGYQIIRKHQTQYDLYTLHNVTCNAGNLKFAVNNPADGVQKHHVAGNIYEAEELAIMERHFSGGTFVDIGTNVGNHTVYFASLEKCSRVISFEPNANAHPLLYANVTLNNLHDKVTIHRVALSNSSQTMALSTPLNNLGGTTLSEQPRGKQTAETAGHCQTMPGDDILQGIDVGFLKVDVEGHEQACLEGLEKTILKCKPAVFIEIDTKDQPQYEAHFSKLGYVVHETYSRYDNVINLLLLPQGS